MAEPAGKLLVVPEVAKMLDVSTATLYRLVERRCIAHYRIPGGLRFRQEDIDAYLARRHVESVQQ